MVNHPQSLTRANIFGGLCVCVPYAFPMFSLSFQRRTADDPSGCTHRPWSANLAMVASPWEVRPRLNWNLQSHLNIERTTTWFMGTRFLWTMPSGWRMESAYKRYGGTPYASIHAYMWTSTTSQLSNNTIYSKLLFTFIQLVGLICFLQHDSCLRCFVQWLWRMLAAQQVMCLMDW